MAKLPRKFNPGLNQDDQSLISQFVVRLPLLKILLETVEDNTTRPACQHRLYFGPRGRGKTMLMARVAAEIRVNDTLSKHWIAIRLFEESYCEIATIAEFWLEVMSELTLCLPKADKENAKLSLNHLKENWSHPNLEQMAQGAVLEQLEKQGKKAIIMVENLHQLIDETNDDFGWAIRRVMQNEKNIMFLATATTRFESLDNANDAFFEIFAISELKRLKRSDVAILWNAITKQDKTENEVAPLDILTGGSPRLLNIVAQFAKDSSIRELMENLTGLVDEHTEYFKSQVDALAPKERRIFLALADLWSESSAKEISERARIDIRTTSALLGRLDQKGALKVNADKPRRKMYSIAERLFCIYYKLRREHSPGSVIEALVQFMVDFYTSEEINEIRRLHLGKELLTIEEELLLQKLDNIDTEHPATSHDLREASTIWKKAITFAQQDDTGQEIAAYKTLIERYQNREEAGIVELVVKAMFNQALADGQQGDTEQELTLYQTLIDCFQSREETSIIELVAKAMYNQAVTYDQQGDTKQALALYQTLIDCYQSREETGIVEQVAEAMFNQALTHGQQGDTKQALERYQTLIARFQSRKETGIVELVAKAMYNQAVTYGQQCNTKQALALYQTLIDRYQNQEETCIIELVAETMYNQALTYDQQGDTKQKLAPYQPLIDRYQSREEAGIAEQVAKAMINQANLFAMQQHWKNAESHYQQLLSRTVDFPQSEIYRSTASLGLLTSQQADTFSEKQRVALAKVVIEANKKSWADKRMTLALGIAAVLPNETALAIIQSSEHKGELQPLLIALRQEMGETVRSSDEALEVAADVTIRIKELRKKYFDTDNAD